MLLALSLTLLQHHLNRNPHVRWDRFTLPAYDAHVYVAMAEQPSVFTVAPWGYRVLTPALVSVIPVPSVVRGFRILTIVGLAGAAVALYGFLRALGHGNAAALASVAIFGLLPPIAACLRYPFLSEPLSVWLEALFLWALAAGAAVPVLALIATLGALSKDLLLLLLPLVALVRWSSHGAARALRDLALVAAPAVAVTVLLRAVWPAAEGSGFALPGATALLDGAGRIVSAWPSYWRSLLLAGLLPLCLIGATRPRARPYVRSYGVIALGFTLLPLAAAVYGGSGSGPVPFFAADVPRLLLYAVPLLIPMALCLLPAPLVAPRPAAAPPRVLALAATAATALLVASPLLLLDRYRRVDLSGPRDGPLVLSLCRETVRTAQRLEGGGSVTWDDTRHFAWGDSDPGQLSRMRWYLRHGWGAQPHYAAGPMVTRDARATLVLPSYATNGVDALLEVSAPVPQALRVSLGSTALLDADVGPEPRVLRVHAAPPALFRGDNLLTLESPAGLRLHAVTLEGTATR